MDVLNNMKETGLQCQGQQCKQKDRFHHWPHIVGLTPITLSYGLIISKMYDLLLIIMTDIEDQLHIAQLYDIQMHFVIL